MIFTILDNAGNTIINIDDDNCTDIAGAVFRANIGGINLSNANLSNMDLRKANLRYGFHPYTGTTFAGSLIDLSDIVKVKDSNLIGAMVFVKGFKSPDRIIEIKTKPKSLELSGNTVVIIDDLIIINAYSVHGTSLVAGTVEYWDQPDSGSYETNRVWNQYRDQIITAQHGE